MYENVIPMSLISEISGTCSLDVLSSDQHLSRFYVCFHSNVNFYHLHHVALHIVYAASDALYIFIVNRFVCKRDRQVP